MIMTVEVAHLWLHHGSSSRLQQQTFSCDEHKIWQFYAAAVAALATTSHSHNIFSQGES
jgi:hypothetical protein